MKISNNIHSLGHFKQSQKKTKNNSQPFIEVVSYPSVDVSKIAFGATQGVKEKSINIELEKSKLLKQLDDVLSTDTPDVDLDDFIKAQVRKCIKFIKNKKKRAIELEKHGEEIVNNNSLNNQQKMNLLGSLQKQLNLLKKSKFPDLSLPKAHPNSETIDFKIYNCFKTALSENNFNLRKVYSDYYSGLCDITTIKELNEKYPKIKTPKNPADVIAEKYLDLLTKDFYLTLDNLIKNREEEKIPKLLDVAFVPLLEDTAQKFNITSDFLYSKLRDSIINSVFSRYKRISEKDTFASLPEYRKNKSPQVSDIDIKLLSVDFDKFVLDVVKEIFVNNKKLNNIVFEEKDLKIPLNTIKSPDYKFDKPSEKIKKIINSSMLLHSAQRDYEKFDVVKLKNRLDYYANTKIANNDKLFESIVEFDSCSFTKEDIPQLILLLREFDNIADGKKSDKEVEKFVVENNISPVGTIKLDAIEREKRVQQLKLEQQKSFELQSIKDRFDNAINILYMNNMTNIAQFCADYRPKCLNDSEIANADFIINQIEQMSDAETFEILNKNKLQSTILHKDIYEKYLGNASESLAFKKAKAYSIKVCGVVDFDKVGQYLMNAEFAEVYPESAKVIKNEDLIKKIFDKSDRESAIEYMCKIDDYNDLDLESKTKLSEILEIFDMKDPVDKMIIKHILEADYANSETVIMTEDIVNGSSKIKSTFAPKAKQALINKYKFPLCIKYLLGFEEALATFCREKGASGIKSTERNNESQVYKIEAKLVGKTDRLFSSKNDFYFDIYSDKGLH